MTTVDLPSLAAQSIPPFESIPVIDISGLFGDADSKAQVASAIQEACIQVGFFYVKNHGVDETVIASALDAAYRFFDLSLEEKMKLHFRKNPKFKGYYPILRKGLINEAFEITPEIGLPSNSELDLWPPEDLIPGFREAVLKYYRDVHGLGLKLSQAFALALNLPEDFFADKMKGGASNMRLLHYPPQTDASDGRGPGIPAHTDYQFFTILWQGDIPALQIKNASGEWINAQPMPGTFVINIADQLSRWTSSVVPFPGD
ncbi:putative 2OG-Fe(II) oxygenase family oxidoreductase [Rhizoctonia solani 123E]|uniref:Putative 2OG-Fe(II) oxygenase family oxidoreductase n=1 Tax=Rhizoctonia solani 123E TaxID=1423351 RepID=A0A074RVN3_9AGAM|nr:putative 2OG-Fe(II) oxygenase family oxidoreductase [Rhizoctonia solani 123E]